ncbi:MAG TPA: ABC transporter permease [Vicinamibacterales bacterium]|nr:ABC transporter permease [Vicinamibacterales bacterium]
MRTFLGDIGYALRMFVKKPAFTLTAILTLGLGIGVAAAIFSVVHAVLLRPLPYERPERLVHIANDMRARNVEDFPWPPADFHDLRTTAQSFSGTAALVTGRQVFVTPGRSEAEQVSTGGATPNLFRVLGARMAVGSDFSDADGTPPPPQQTGPQGAPAAAATPPPPPRTIISHAFWQRRFGGDPAVVGTVVRLGEQPFEVIGVLEPGFELLYPPDINVEPAPDVWTPLTLDFAAGSRINVFLRVIARLRDDATIASAQREVDALAADLRSRFPIKHTAGMNFRIEPMHEDLVREVRPVILALMGAVTFVLLIACANVANLLLVRAAARERELAVRAALGGTRGRLLRQLLTESLLLGAAAIGVGLLFAWAGVRVLVALGPENLPRLGDVGVDPTVVSFAAVAGLLSVVLFGLVPAVRASSPDVMDLLRRAGRSGNLSAGGWVRAAVVTAEVALSFVLLVGAGLMIRSFVALQRAEPGYDPRGVLTFSTPNLRLPDPAARQAFMRNMRERLKAMPGVIDATAANPLPLDGREANARWGTEAALSDPSKFGQATTHVVLPGYFTAMRTRIIEGREYTEADNRPDSRYLIIDRLLAAKAYPGQSAVGKTIVARINTQEPQRYEVIGVVDHQRHASLARDGREAMFVADGYFNHGPANRWAVRASGDPSALAGAVRALVSELNPRTGAIEVQPMMAYVAGARAQTKFTLVLIAIFAGVALLLAAVGLYSVLSTTVRQRTAEIGVRMAFGAEHGRIFRMMVVQGLRLSAAGIVLGVAAALLLTGVLRTMLVGVEPTDPATFAAMAAGFLVVAAIACGLPALRASRLDPMVALREE